MSKIAKKAVYPVVDFLKLRLPPIFLQKVLAYILDITLDQKIYSGPSPKLVIFGSFKPKMSKIAKTVVYPVVDFLKMCLPPIFSLEILVYI